MHGPVRSPVPAVLGRFERLKRIAEELDLDDAHRRR